MRYISVNQAEQATSGHHAAVLGNGVAQQDTKRAIGSLFLLAARARSLRAENSIIPPGWSFVKRKIAQILNFLTPEICAIFRYCISLPDALYCSYRKGKGNTKND